MARPVRPESIAPPRRPPQRPQPQQPPPRPRAPPGWRYLVGPDVQIPPPGNTPNGLRFRWKCGVGNIWARLPSLWAAAAVPAALPEVGQKTIVVVPVSSRSPQLQRGAGVGCAKMPRATATVPTPPSSRWSRAATRSGCWESLDWRRIMSGPGFIRNDAVGVGGAQR